MGSNLNNNLLLRLPLSFIGQVCEYDYVESSTFYTRGFHVRSLNVCDKLFCELVRLALFNQTCAFFFNEHFFNCCVNYSVCINETTPLKLLQIKMSLTMPQIILEKATGVIKN